ncbi:hypothetical protein [Acidovorax sp. PRC11]|uniref:hypothetical protein n=1 Tax=Acidovorax sp. PRC11 TaxID=2962592 RepID=UPI00288143BF|nr:hypothetical protein [Acidovorax sp. PRC11]MDT0139008.1 hypothetical protein [Acidovorax sp. PRC11]
MKIKLALLITTTFLFTGCAYNVAPYGAAVQNVEAIKAYNLQPVAVGSFQSAKPGNASLTCRAAGPVTVSPNFESYIQQAFVDELKLAGIYSATSPLVLTGKLEEVDFSSGMTDGNWSFTLTLTNSRNESFTTKSRFNFSGSFVADKACQEVAQAFGPAVQKLVGDVIRDPKFRQIAN